VQLEHIFDDELAALCRARNLTASTNIQHCIIPTNGKWEIITVAKAAKQAIPVRDFHIAKVRVKA
jgi:hypothetical protein